MTDTSSTFNLEYQEAYTSKIEFNTQINEKQPGREQRYPVYTFPKRTFTLKFDKDPQTRKQLEDFFISVMGQAGKFYWKWESSKGGNDKTYLCSFDSDTLKQNLKYFGYTECDLTLVCIDDKPITPPESFDFYHKAECDYSIEFYSLIDKVLTAQDNRKSYWDTPKRSWKLSFDKDPQTRKQLEDFFISKRGCFRSFDWKWDKAHGGDDNIYHVRFNSDILSSSIDWLGYGTLDVELKEVVQSVYTDKETAKDEIIPRKLLEIELNGGSIYVLDNETLSSLNYNGKTFIGAPLTHGEITRDDNTSVSKLNVTLSNIALSISGIIGNRGNVINNAPASLILVFLNINTNEILNSPVQILWAGKCNNLKLDYENASNTTTTNYTYKYCENPAWVLFDFLTGYNGLGLALNNDGSINEAVIEIIF